MRVELVSSQHWRRRRTHHGPDASRHNHQNAEATAKRVDHLQGMILDGQSNTVGLIVMGKRGGAPERRAYLLP